MAGGASHHPFSFVVESGETVASVAARLGIPEGLLTAVSLNNTAVPLNTPLHAGDQLTLFPPATGGAPTR